MAVQISVKLSSDSLTYMCSLSFISDQKLLCNIAVFYTTVAKSHFEIDENDYSHSKLMHHFVNNTRLKILISF